MRVPVCISVKYKITHILKRTSICAYKHMKACVHTCTQRLHTYIYNSYLYSVMRRVSSVPACVVVV